MKIRTAFVSNSSSESFICETNLSPEKVKELLILLLDFYNKFTDNNEQFEDVFNEPYVGAKEDIKVKCFVSFVVGLAIGVVIMLIV